MVKTHTGSTALKQPPCPPPANLTQLAAVKVQGDDDICPINSLPSLVIHKIFSVLDSADKIRCLRVCKRWSAEGPLNFPGPFALRIKLHHSRDGVTQKALFDKLNWLLGDVHTVIFDIPAPIVHRSSTHGGSLNEYPVLTPAAKAAVRRITKPVTLWVHLPVDNSIVQTPITAVLHLRPWDSIRITGSTPNTPCRSVLQSTILTKCANMRLDNVTLQNNSNLNTYNVQSLALSDVTCDDGPPNWAVILANQNRLSSLYMRNLNGTLPLPFFPLLSQIELCGVTVDKYLLLLEPVLNAVARVTLRSLVVADKIDLGISLGIFEGVEELKELRIYTDVYDLLGGLVGLTACEKLDTLIVRCKRAAYCWPCGLSAKEIFKGHQSMVYLDVNVEQPILASKAKPLYRFIGGRICASNKVVEPEERNSECEQGGGKERTNEMKAGGEKKREKQTQSKEKARNKKEEENEGKEEKEVAASGIKATGKGLWQEDLRAVQKKKEEENGNEERRNKEMKPGVNMREEGLVTGTLERTITRKPKRRSIANDPSRYAPVVGSDSPFYRVPGQITPPTIRAVRLETTPPTEKQQGKTPPNPQSNVNKRTPANAKFTTQPMSHSGVRPSPLGSTPNSSHQSNTQGQKPGSRSKLQRKREQVILAEESAQWKREKEKEEKGFDEEKERLEAEIAAIEAEMESVEGELDLKRGRQENEEIDGGSKKAKMEGQSDEEEDGEMEVEGEVEGEEEEEEESEYEMEEDPVEKQRLENEFNAKKVVMNIMWNKIESLDKLEGQEKDEMALFYNYLNVDLFNRLVEVSHIVPPLFGMSLKKYAAQESARMRQEEAAKAAKEAAK